MCGVQRLLDRKLCPFHGESRVSLKYPDFGALCEVPSDSVHMQNPVTYLVGAFFRAGWVGKVVTFYGLEPGKHSSLTCRDQVILANMRFFSFYFLDIKVLHWTSLSSLLNCCFAFGRPLFRIAARIHSALKEVSSCFSQSLQAISGIRGYLTSRSASFQTLPKSFIISLSIEAVWITQLIKFEVDSLLGYAPCSFVQP